MNRSNKIRINKPELQLGLIIALIAVIISLYSSTDSGNHLTSRTLDILRSEEPRKDIVIIGIDDKSLQAIGAWPWDRDVFARFHLALLKQSPRAIGYDVLFLEPRRGDDAFVSSLKSSEIPVVLAAKYANGKYLESFLGESTGALSGLVNVPTDKDGKVRLLASGLLDDETCHETLAFQLYRLVNPFISSCLEKPAYFRYSEPKIISFIDVMEGRSDLTSLQNAYVLIGSNSLDLPDHFVGIDGNKIPGVQVHASMLSSLLSGNLDSRATNVFSGILIFLFAILAGSIAYFIKRLEILVVSAVLLTLAIISLAVIVFDKHLILPLPWMLASALASFIAVVIWRSMRDRKQNEYIKNIFGKFVHDDVLKELLREGQSVNLGGVKRRLTIFFSDLRGFTTLSEKLPPLELTSLLNDYFSAMSPVILESKGTIDKYIGDAIMAFWNAPLDVKNHEEKAVRSAIKMIEELNKFNKEHASSLKIGIGIHTGEAVVGNFGSMDRINYTALGDNVNLASRLESLTKKYNLDIIVTKDTKEECKATDIIFRKIDNITVKGKKNATTIYEPMRANEKNEKIISSYEKAFTQYEAGNFDEAKVLFQEEILKNDGPSELMISRINKLREEPLTEWKGVYEWEEK